MINKEKIGRFILRYGTPIFMVFGLTITLLTPLKWMGNIFVDAAGTREMQQAPALSVTPVVPKKTTWVTVTSYNSEPGQTDSTPFTTASGTQTRDGIVAANFLPFGTKVRFPEAFGEKIFVVEDRMHPRHKQKVDIWHADKKFSIKFGVRRLKMEVL